ncbi:MAG: acyltransferase [Chitinophagales bacterium]|nr:acyltransferase [Chitinophagales bacterium]
MNIKEKLAKRNIGIDILRGFCILAVILLHLNIRFNFTGSFLKESLPPKLFSLLFWSGFYGVVIFFTLSGYLITSSILKRWNSLSNISLKTFYWFRFSRIIPLLLTLVFVLSALHLLNIPGFTINTEQTSLSRAIFSTLTFHMNWLQIQIGYLPANWDVLWSISIEESFYLVFPLVCLFLKKDWQFVFVLILFLVISPWARTQLFVGNELGDRNHLAYVDSIAFGCMTAIIAHKTTLPKMLNLFFLFLGWAMLSLVMVFRSLVYKSGLVDLGLNITVLSLGVALILFWMHENHRSGRERNRPIFNWLRHMGIYSYEIYLTHMFVVILGVRAYKQLGLGTEWMVPVSLLIILVSYLLGHIVFNYFSEPVNLWLRKKWNKL